MSIPARRCKAAKRRIAFDGVKKPPTRYLLEACQRLIRSLSGPTVWPIAQQLARANLPEREKRITNPVAACGRRFFSQNDEDGILLEILRRVGIDEPSAFLEFGLGDGTECNTIILLAKGWCGAWVGGEPLSFDVPKDGRLAFSQQWVTKDNVAVLARDTLSKLGLDLARVRVASVDLDGNDGQVVEGLLAAGLAPDIFIVEYNAKFPPGIEFEMPYDERHAWRMDDYYGVSLQHWVGMFSKADYRLVACNENGVNAFFVKNEHATRFEDIPTEIEQLYRVGHHFPYPRSGHVTSPRTVRYLARGNRNFVKGPDRGQWPDQ